MPPEHGKIPAYEGATVKTTTFHCPACRQWLEAPEDYVGLMVECPGCRSVLKVPEPGGADALIETSSPAEADGEKAEERGRTARIELPPNLGIPEPSARRTIVIRRRQGRSD